MNITPISPSAYCEKSIVRNLASNMSESWSVVGADQKNILINNLASNSIYHVCMKCRQIYSDPDGDEECREIKTLSRFNWFFRQKFFIIFIISIIAVLIILNVILFFWRENRRNTIRLKPTNTNSEEEDDSQSTPIFVDEDSPVNSSHYSIADINEVIAQTSAPKYLPIDQNSFIH